MKVIRTLLAFVASPILVAMGVWMVGAAFMDDVARKPEFSIMIELLWLVPSFVLLGIPAHLFLSHYKRSRWSHYASTGAIAGTLVGSLPFFNHPSNATALAVVLGAPVGVLSALVFWGIAI